MGRSAFESAVLPATWSAREVSAADRATSWVDCDELAAAISASVSWSFADWSQINASKARSAMPAISATS